MDYPAVTFERKTSRLTGQPKIDNKIHEIHAELFNLIRLLTLCAFKEFSWHASVTSTKDCDSSNSWNTEVKLLW